MRRAIGRPGQQFYQQPNCSRCGLARFTETDREIGPLCSLCAEQPRNQETVMARTMRANTVVDDQGNEIEQEPVKRGRPQKRPMAMGSNVSDATISEFGNRALTAKLEAEKKRDEAKTQDSIYRGVLKEAKGAGVDPDSIRWWLKARKQEPEDLDREIAWQNRMARVMGLPIGTQLGVDFETGETVATLIDEKHTRSRRGGKAAAKKNGRGDGEADPRAAYILGYDAGKAGKSPKTAGRGITGAAATEFQKGWQQGMKDAGKEHGPEATMQ